MGDRLELHAILSGLLESSNVYFQPPEDLKLLYPCIVYSRDSIGTEFANDKPYYHKLEYAVTLIDEDPDSEILKKIAMLPMCAFSRHYVADNLNHDVFNLYY